MATMFAINPLKKAIAPLMLLFAAMAVSFSSNAAIAQTNNISAELVAEGAAVPGSQIMLAIHFTPEPGWHGYWKNPGDAGYGMQLDWQLPAGWQAGEPLYPVPRRLLISDLMNHVYKGPYAVLIPLNVPSGAAARQAVRISVAAQWLACTDVICVPEQAMLSTIIPPSAGPQTSGRSDDRFTTWRPAIPPVLDRAGTFEITDSLLRIAIPLPAALELPDPHVYLANLNLVGYASPQHFSRTGDLLIAEIPLALFGDKPGTIEGIMAFRDGEGVRFTAQSGVVPVGSTTVIAQDAVTPPLVILLLGALVGGLLLNIMPCVFPILSLKALSLARAGESTREARAEGLAYSAGVILACVALGGLLLMLRAAGEQVGWAFQLQEPGVVVALAVLAAAITANLAGLFQLPSVSITRSGEPASAFATGLLAAVVATPCTGPFMAAALGAALLLPPVQSLALFAALGTGLALPFLLIGLIPALRKLLPRPGPWMETFRRFMAVPMGLTAMALLWLVWRLGGWWFAVLTLGLAGAVIAAFAIFGSGQRRSAAVRSGGLAALATGALMAFGLPGAFDGAAQQSGAGMLRPVAFSAKNLAAARASGKPVFVWFTADWCVTCKVNESVAIEREATRAAFEKAGVIAIRGDWTRRDPEISAFLTSQGVAGIPLYIWYDPGGQARQLDQVLGPDALTELAAAP